MAGIKEKAIKENNYKLLKDMAEIEIKMHEAQFQTIIKTDGELSEEKFANKLKCERNNFGW